MTLMGRGDLDDQRWLDQQVATLGDGIEAARAIWLNWSDLRNVGRLHPGRSAGQYIASLVSSGQPVIHDEFKISAKGQ